MCAGTATGRLPASLLGSFSTGRVAPGGITQLSRTCTFSRLTSMSMRRRPRISPRRPGPIQYGAKGRGLLEVLLAWHGHKVLTPGHEGEGQGGADNVGIGPKARGSLMNVLVMPIPLESGSRGGGAHAAEGLELLHARSHVLTGPYLFLCGLCGPFAGPGCHSRQFAALGARGRLHPALRSTRSAPPCE